MALNPLIAAWIPTYQRLRGQALQQRLAASNLDSRCSPIDLLNAQILTGHLTRENSLDAAYQIFALDGDRDVLALFPDEPALRTILGRLGYSTEAANAKIRAFYKANPEAMRLHPFAKDIHPIKYAVTMEVGGFLPTATTAAPTNGMLWIGRTGTAPVAATLTQAPVEPVWQDAKKQGVAAEPPKPAVQAPVAVASRPEPPREPEPKGAPACIICYENQVSCACYPCMCMGLCRTCASNAAIVDMSKGCPTCRKPITQIMRVAAVGIVD